jgi:hypothetical protein
VGALAIRLDWEGRTREREIPLADSSENPAAMAELETQFPLGVFFSLREGSFSPRMRKPRVAEARALPMTMGRAGARAKTPLAPCRAPVGDCPLLLPS